MGKVFILISLSVLMLMGSCQERDSVDLRISNHNPKAGQSVRMTCNIRLAHPVLFGTSLPENVLVILQKDRVPFTQNEVVTNTDFTNRTSVSIGTSYSLMVVDVDISSISRNDFGVYRCVVFNSGKSYLSRDYSVSVRYYPDVSYPRCSSATERVYLGNQITIWCTSEAGNPTVELRWRSRNEATNKTSLQPLERHSSSENGSIKSTLTLTTTAAASNDEYTCEMYSSDFADKLQSCVVSVQTIWSVSLTVYPDKLSVAFDSSARFTCRTSNAVGDIGIYEWLTIPKIDQSRVMTIEDDIEITNTQLLDNGTLIYCIVLFEDRWFQSLPGLLLIDNKDVSSQTHEPQTVVQYPIQWIVAFVLILAVCIVLIFTIVCLLLRRKTTKVNSKSKVGNVLSNSPSEPGESYVTLQGTLARGQEEYTELNALVPSASDNNDQVYADCDENAGPYSQGNEYAYADTDQVMSPVISPAKTPPEAHHTYGNVK